MKFTLAKRFPRRLGLAAGFALFFLLVAYGRPFHARADEPASLSPATAPDQANLHFDPGSGLFPGSGRLIVSVRLGTKHPKDSPVQPRPDPQQAFPGYRWQQVAGTWIEIPVAPNPPAK